jgi:hypothetical protein
MVDKETQPATVGTGEEPRMARRKRKGGRPEVLSRSVKVVETETRIWICAHKPRGANPVVESRPWLGLRGTMNEPVRGVSDIEINLYPDAKVESEPKHAECIGAVIDVKPLLNLVVAASSSAFDLIWALALSGQLKHASCTFTKPHYRSAQVTSLSVSNKPESDE